MPWLRPPTGEHFCTAAIAGCVRTYCGTASHDAANACSSFNTRITDTATNVRRVGASSRRGESAIIASNSSRRVESIETRTDQPKGGHRSSGGRSYRGYRDRRCCLGDT